MPLEEKIRLLRTADLFAGSGEDFLASIAMVLRGIRARSQQTIFKKGDPGDAMYIITSGSVRVHDGSHVLGRLKARDVFGEYALIDEGRRSASVTAEEESY